MSCQNKTLQLIAAGTLDPCTMTNAEIIQAYQCADEVDMRTLDRIFANCCCAATTPAVCSPLPAPSSLVATPNCSESELVITWLDNSTDETDFELQRSLGPGPIPTSWTVPATLLAADSVTLTDALLTAGTEYFYRIRAVRSSDSCPTEVSEWSIVGSGTTAALGAPDGLVATPFSETQIDLVWNDNSLVETGYDIERSPDGVGSWVSVLTPAADATAASDTGLTTATQYFYRIRATGPFGAFSCWSDVATATTAAALAPDPPSLLVATMVSDTEIDLTWQDNSSNELNFELERSLTGVGAWVLIFSPIVNAVAQSDSGLVLSTQYFYRIRAVNGAGNSAYSNTADATTAGALAAPVLAAVKASLVSADLTWPDIVGETSYEIEARLTVGPGAWGVVATPAMNATAATISGLIACQSYDFRIRATDGFVFSPWSNIPTADLEITAITDLTETLAYHWRAEDWTSGAWVDNVAAHSLAVNGNPTKIASFQGTGLPAIVLDGTGDFFEDAGSFADGNALFAAAGAGTVVIVLKITDKAADQTLWQSRDTTDPVSWIQQRIDNGTPDVFGMQRKFDAAESISAHSLAPSYDVPIVIAGMSGGTLFADTGVGAAAMLLEYTGAGTPTHAHGGNASQELTTHNSFAIGGSPEGSDAQIEIAEVLIYSGVVTDAEAACLARFMGRGYLFPSQDFPEAPTSLVAVPGGLDTEIDLTWVDNSDDETSFQLERSLTGVGGWALAQTPVTNATSITDTALTPGVQYFYRIRAVNAIGNGAWSNVADATTVSGGILASLQSQALGFYEPDVAAMETNVVAKFVAANSEYLSITDAAQVGLSPAAASFSVSAWVRVDADAANRVIFGKWDETGNLREWRLVKDATDSLVFQVSVNGTAVAQAVSVAKVDGNWHHVVGIYDGVNIAVIMDDAAPVTTAFATALNASTAQVYIGARDSGASQLWNGDMSDVAYWSTDISAADVTELYNAGVRFGLGQLSAPLVAKNTSYWPLTEPGGTRADYTGTNDMTDNATVLMSLPRLPSRNLQSTGPDYYSITDAAQTGLNPGATPFTVVAWVRVGGTGLFHVSKYLTAGNQFGFSFTKFSDGKIYFGCSADGSTTTSVNGTPSAGWSASEYRMIAVTWDGTNIRILDSPEDSSDPWLISGLFAGPIFASNTKYAVGMYDDGGTVSDNVDVACVMHYAKSLSRVELVQLNRKTTLIPSSPKAAMRADELPDQLLTGLVSMWEFKNNGTIIDQIGANDLTQNGAATNESAGTLMDPDRFYPCPVNGMVTKWANTSTLVDSNKFDALITPYEFAGNLLNADGTLQLGAWPALFSQQGLVNDPTALADDITIIAVVSLDNVAVTRNLFDGMRFLAVPADGERLAGNLSVAGDHRTDTGATGFVFTGAPVTGRRFYYCIFAPVAGNSEFWKDGVLLTQTIAGSVVIGEQGLVFGDNFNLNGPISVGGATGYLERLIVLPRALTAGEKTDLDLALATPILEALQSESEGFFEPAAASFETNLVAKLVRANSEKLVITDAAQTGLDPVGNFSVVAWVKCGNTAQSRGIVGKYTAAGNQLSWAILIQPTDLFSVTISPDGTGGSSVILNHSTAKGDDIWRLVALVYDGANLKISVDGAAFETSALASPAFDSTADVSIGSIDNANHVDGEIGDVMFYSAALSIGELITLYNGGRRMLPSAILQTNLVSHWPLNESSGTRFDLKGSNDLTDTNTVLADFYRKPSAAMVTGDSTALAITDAAQVGLSIPGSAFTLMCWFKGGGSGVTAGLVGKWEPTNPLREFLIEQTPAGDINFHLRTTTTLFTATQVGVFDDEWHLAVMTWNGSTLRTYIDDNTRVNVAAAGTAENGTAEFAIGRYDGVANHWSGEIAAVGKFDRELTNDEIDEFHNNGHAAGYADLTTAQKAGLVSWWELDEESGVRVDSHGPNDLTDVGTVLWEEGVIANSHVQANEHAGVTKWLNTSANPTPINALLNIHPELAPAMAAVPEIEVLTEGLYSVGSHIAQAFSIVLVATQDTIGDSDIMTDGYEGSLSTSPDRAIIWDNASFYALFGGTSAVGTLVPTTGRKVFVGVFDGTSSKLYVDGTEITLTPNSPGVLDLAGLSVGTSITFADGLEGKVERVILISRVITPAEVALLQAAL